MSYKKAAILFLIITLPLQLWSQMLYIKKGKKKIKILTGARISIFPAGENKIPDEASDSLAFSIKNTSADSISIQRPVQWKDTFTYKFNIWTGKEIPDKKKYFKKVVQYEVKDFALSSVSQIRYTYQNDQSGDGCIGCLFIPGLNIYYLLSKKYHTRNFDMSQWKFSWE